MEQICRFWWILLVVIVCSIQSISKLQFLFEEINPLQSSETSVQVKTEQGLWEEPWKAFSPGRQITTNWQWGFLGQNQIITQVISFVSITQGFSVVATCHIFSRRQFIAPRHFSDIPITKNPDLLAISCSPPGGYDQCVDFSVARISLSDMTKSLNKNKMSHKQLQHFPSTQNSWTSAALTIFVRTMNFQWRPTGTSQRRIRFITTFLLVQNSVIRCTEN